MICDVAPHNTMNVCLTINLFNQNLIFYCLFYDLGDGDYKPYVSSDPDITTVEMNGSEDFIIIACDGLWDTVTPSSATKCVYRQLQTDKGK